MSKRQIAISIDEELLARVDRVADKREESRSAIIEKLVGLGIEEQEQLIGDRDVSVFRELMWRMMESPKFMETFARIAGESAKPGELQELSSKAVKFRKIRSASRKNRKVVQRVQGA